MYLSCHSQENGEIGRESGKRRDRESNMETTLFYIYFFGTMDQDLGTLILK